MPAIAKTSLLASLNAFCRLEIYTGITPTTAMTNTVSLKIMVEVLTILTISTMTANRGRMSELILRRFMILD